jgi:hypothetical protein
MLMTGADDFNQKQSSSSGGGRRDESGQVIALVDASDDPRWQAGVQGSYSFDSDGRSGWSLGIYAGGAQRIADNLDLHATVNFNVYQNQQGVDRSGGYGFDFTAALMGVAGFGEGSALPLNTLNNYTTMAVPDTFSQSIAFGQMLTYNSTLDQSTIKGNVALKLGDVNVWYSNDSSSAPSFAGFFVPGWASSDSRSTDSGWTGGGGINIALPNDYQLAIYSETFTGVAKNRFNQNREEQPWTSPNYYQSNNDYGLNRTDTGLRYSAPEGYQLSISYIDAAYAQNYIHDNGGFIPKSLYDNGERYHRFEHPWQGGFEIKTGYNSMPAGNNAKNK